MKQRNPWAWVPTLYFAEGVPYVAVMTISLVMYKRLGLSNTDITLYTSWLYLPWVIKPLWSPFVDILRTKRWWILTMQLLIAASLGGVAFTIPGEWWLQASLFCFWVMAFASATHDIAADGFYMLGLDQHQQAFFVGIRSTFYRIATIVSSGLLVGLAQVLQGWTGSIPYSWSLVFYGMAALFIALWLWHSFMLPHAEKPEATSGTRDEDGQKNTFAQIGREFADTVITFFKKPQVLVGLAFMLFYRMPEGLLVKVSSLFLIDNPSNGGLGLSDGDYGLVQGTVGVIGLTLGGILGGIAASRDGLKRWLWPMVLAITVPDIVYVVLAWWQPTSLWFIGACVCMEQFGYGFGFTAYMLYLIYYSQGDHKTSHYALCTAFMALSMMIPGLFSGALQELVGYKMFFLIVVTFCAITYIVTALIKIEPSFGKKNAPEDAQQKSNVTK